MNPYEVIWIKQTCITSDHVLYFVNQGHIEKSQQLVCIQQNAWHYLPNIDYFIAKIVTMP